MKTAKIVSIDTETTGLNIRDGRDVAQGISLAWKSHSGSVEALYLPVGHLFGPNLDWQRLKPRMQEIIDTRPSIMHRAMFDLVSMETLGLNTTKSPFFCTMLLSHQLDENRYSNTLDACAKSWINDPGKKADAAFKQYTDKVGWRYVPSGMMNEYAAYDADLPLRLFDHLWPKVIAEGTQANWKHRMQMVRLINSMEAYGVGVDLDLCARMAEQGHKRMAELTGALGNRNPGSPKVLHEILIEELGLPVVKRSKKTGDPSFDKEAMDYYEEILEHRNNPLAKQILEYRGWQKATSSNYESYAKFLSPDGRLRTNYNLNGTVSGRLSSREPNLQQIPKAGVKPWNGQMKKCFVAEEGWSLIEVDYSQLEFRMATSYAHVDSLIEVFNNPKRDIFDEMSAEFKQDRDPFKTRFYARQYGAGADRIAHVGNISKHEAQAWMDEYDLRWPGFKKAKLYAQYTAENTGKIQLWSGRYRHFQFKSEYHKAFNSLVQGGAADIVEHTMLRCAKAGFNDPDRCRMLLQVHDSIVFEIRNDLLKEYVPAIKDCMSDVNSGPVDWGVKFAVDAHVFGTKDKL